MATASGDEGGRPIDADKLGGSELRELVLSAESAPGGAQGVLPAADVAARAGMRSADFDPYRDLAETRRSIAAWLIAILAAAMLLLAVVPMLALLFLPGPGDATSFEHVRDILLIVFSPLVTLVTAVAAFYFGEKSAGRRPD